VSAMTLRSTLYPNTGFKLNAADTLDAFDTKQLVVGTVSLKRAETTTTSSSSPSYRHHHHHHRRDVVSLNAQDVPPGVQVPAESTPGVEQKHQHHHHHHTANRVAEAATAAAQEEQDSTAPLAGIRSPGRPMGGEGTPVKGKPLPIDNMDNPQMAINNNPKEAGGGGGGGGGDESAKGVVPGVLGTASIELSAEGKWRNVRKTPANPHSQANCLRQILLLQLDLIEQQQQQLQSKDKEIDDLKAEKETVCVHTLEARAGVVCAPVSVFVIVPNPPIFFLCVFLAPPPGCCCVCCCLLCFSLPKSWVCNKPTYFEREPLCLNSHCGL